GLFLTAVALFLLPYGSKVTSREFVRDINIYLPHFLKINNLHIMVVLAFVMGIANALVFVPSNTIVQEETSDEVRGKVYGALNTVVSLVSLVPVILVGSLADIFGVAVVLTVLAIGVVLIGVGRLFL
ncbi:MAG TPA: MFS transporter, partial [Patescibacteria group bacterium]|nr:MFS transporter [Patescibacteria group bacterium]